MTKEELKQARELCEKATPGPWFNNQYNRTINVTFESAAHGRGHFNICKYPMRTTQSLVSHDEWVANADLIALSRTLVPKLLDLVEKQRKTIEINSRAITLLLDQSDELKEQLRLTNIQALQED